MKNKDQSLPSRYAGFISYSQKDKIWAKRIHKALETYRLPIGLPGAVKDKKKLGRFFRDDDELSGAPSLGDALDAAIDGSNALIVICSPNSAKSKWVDAEIRRFKRRGENARVLAIIVGGQPDPEDPNEQCFPPSLLVKVNSDGTLTDEPDEPLAPDVRKDTFPRLITRLVAGLMDVEFDTLWQREKRRVMRRRVLASVAGVLLLASFSGLYNWKQNQMVDQARQASIDEYKDKSELLSGVTKAAAQTEDYTLAALLSLEGVNHAPEFLGDRTINMGDTLSHLAGIKEVLWISKAGERFASTAKYSPDGKYVLTKWASDIYIWDAKNGQEISQINQAYTIETAEFSPNSEYIVTTSLLSPVTVWNVADGTAKTKFRGHTGTVNTALFSPDGKYVVTASADKSAQVWVALTGEVVAKLSGHTQGVNSAVFSKKQDYIVTASEDKTMRIWSRDGKKSAKYDGHTGGVKTAVLGPKERYILTTSHRDNFAVKFDIKSRKASGLYHMDKISSAMFSPAGVYILTVSGSEAYLWRAKTGKKTASLGHDEDITSAAFSANGRHVITSSGETTYIWDTKSGDKVTVLKGHSARIGSASFSPDGRSALTASFYDKTVRVWQAERAEIIGHLSGFNFSALSRDNQYALVVGSAVDDHSARIWNLKTRKKISSLSDSEGKKMQIKQAAFSPDIQSVVTLSGGAKNAHIWTVKTGVKRTVLNGHEKHINQVSFSPDGQYAATASDDNTARIWSTVTGDQVRILKGHEYGVNTVSFSPDGRHVITTSQDRTARVWGVESGKEISAFKGHTSAIDLAVFSPNGKFVASAHAKKRARSPDKTVRIWDAKTGKEISVLPESVKSIAFSQDSRHVLTASSDGDIRIWDVQTGEEITLMSDIGKRVFAAKYSPDGRYVMARSQDRSIRVWDATSGSQLGAFKDHKGKILSANYSGDGRSIVSTSQDGTVRRWELPYVIANEVLAKPDLSFTQRQNWVFAAGAKSVLRCLTPQERKTYELPADPPCWCQEKSYPSMSVWEDDYLSRRPDLMPKSGKWPDNTPKPNPFTHIRDDGWMCPAADSAYSAPWLEFSDLNKLSTRDILGPANLAFEKLKTMDTGQ